MVPHIAKSPIDYAVEGGRRAAPLGRERLDASGCAFGECHRGYAILSVSFLLRVLAIMDKLLRCLSSALRFGQANEPHWTNAHWLLPASEPVSNQPRPTSAANLDVEAVGNAGQPFLRKGVDFGDGEVPWHGATKP